MMRGLTFTFDLVQLLSARGTAMMVRVGFVVSFLLIGVALTAEQDYSSQIEEQQRSVQEAQAGLTGKKAIHARKTHVMEEAYRGFVTARDARAKWQRQGTALQNSTAKIDRKIEEQESRLRVLQQLLTRERDPERRASHEREIRAQEMAIASLTRQKERQRKQGDIAGQVETHRAAAKRIEDTYWSSLRSHRQALNDAWLSMRQVQFQKEQIAGRRKALADLRIAASQAFRETAPAYLQKVEARVGNEIRYLAEWRSLRQVTDDKIDFMRRAIEDQQKQLTRQQQARDLAKKNFYKAADESIELLHQYEQGIWDQAYRAISLEIVNSAINIANDYRKMGPYGFLVEAGAKVYDASTADLKGAYAMPTVSGNGPSGSMRQLLTWENQKEVAEGTAISSIYSVIVKAVEAAHGGNWQFVVDEPHTAAGRGVQAVRKRMDVGELWIIPKEQLMFAPNQAAHSLRTERDAVREGFRLMFRRRPFSQVAQELANHSRRVWREFDWNGTGTGLLTGVVQEMVKNEVLELNKLPRLRIYQSIMEHDTIYYEWLELSRLCSVVYRFEQRQLAAYQQYLDQLLDEREALADERRLVLEQNAPLVEGAVEFLLEFSRPVDVKRVLVGDQSLAGRTTGSRWSATGIIGPQKKNHVALVVEARTTTTGQELDANPRSIPLRKTSGPMRWSNYEAGPDRQHRLMIAPESGSMAHDGPVKARRVFDAVADQPSATYRNNTDNRLRIETKDYDPVPYAMAKPFSTTVSRGKSARVWLAGDTTGTASWSVDNFLFVEILAGAQQRRFAIGAVAPLRYQGQVLGRFSKDGYTHSPFDLTPYIPPGVPVRLSISALDYGGRAFVSDLFLVVKPAADNASDK